MENLKTVSALVKNILEHDHKARNTDNHLYLKVLEHYSGLRGIDIHAMTVPVFLKELDRRSFCVLGNLLTNVVSYVIGILLLVIGGSAIYCIVKALWQSLLILVVLGIATIAVVFLLVWAVMKAENIGESLGAFIRS